MSSPHSHCPVVALYVEPVGTEQSGTQMPSCIISPGSHPTGGAAVDVVDDVSSADAHVGDRVGVLKLNIKFAAPGVGAFTVGAAVAVGEPVGAYVSVVGA